ACSVLAAAFSPLPAQLAEALPTYVGLRVDAQDLRAKMNLKEGLSAMDSFRDARGSYAGFDAAAGQRIDDGLAWHHDPPVRFGPATQPAVHVVAARARRAELLALSGSGSAFCIREDLQAGQRPRITYGVGEPPERGAPASRGAAAVTAALTACGSVPWTA